MAIGLLNFVFFILNSLLGLLVLAIIVNAILSWLFAFDVINYRNRFVAGIAGFLDSVVGPLLAPFRRFIPPLGGIDVTPIVALLVIQGVQRFLLPASYSAIAQLINGG